MAQVYIADAEGRSQAIPRLRCENEDRELQRLLDQNFDLLPGDQINPEDPCRWLLVKREMPVPDPSTGADRWSIDLAKELGHGGDAMVTRVYGHLGQVRHRAEVVEYRADQHADRLGRRLTALGL